MGVAPHDRALNVADTPARLLGAHPADIVPTLALSPQAAHVLCIVDYSAAQSQMQTLRAVGLKRLHAMDWIGATAATEDATIYAALHPAQVNTLTIAGWAPFDR
jgi:poly(3-hydroxybutyrate) depolymerase